MNVFKYYITGYCTMMAVLKDLPAPPPQVIIPPTGIIEAMVEANKNKGKCLRFATTITGYFKYVDHYLHD